METTNPTQTSKVALEGNAHEEFSDRGTVFTEYLVIAMLVTIGGAAAVIAVGVPFAQYYRFTIALLAVPFP